ncbi:MAG TPA: cytochrome c oxidase subunit 3 [Limnochorda sp.]
MAQHVLEREKPSAQGPPQGPTGPGRNGFGPDRYPPRPAPAPATAGIWLLLAAAGMLFLGFTSSYLSRQAGADWVAIPMPRVLWATTALLAVSSALLEWGRRSSGRRAPNRLAAGVSWAAWLGALFVLGQLAAWRELAAAGVFLASNPHASFFYVLTLVHGLHVLAGLIWLFIAAARVRAGGPRAASTVRPAAIYWHFVGLLWVYLWVLLFWI